MLLSNIVADGDARHTANCVFDKQQDRTHRLAAIFRG
jgi:hypothetical protein